MNPADPIAPHAGLNAYDFLAVGGYLLVTMLIVWWSSRKQHDTEDFFLGGRRMPWLAVGLSMMATLLSTITYLGSPGEMIKNGIGWFTGYLAIPVAMVVVLLVWIPFFMRLKMTSAYEYLEQRFDWRARLLAGVLFLLLRLGWIAMVVYTASMAMVAMASEHLDWLLNAVGLAGTVSPIHAVIAVVGVAATIYTCLGGMRAVIWTDVLQAFMLFGGVFLIIFYVIWATGTGPVEWWAKAREASDTHVSPIWFSFDPTVRVTLVTAMLQLFFWTICTHSADQVVLQRYFTTASLPAARWTYITNTLSSVAIAILLSLSGLALLYFYLEHPNYLPEGLTAKSNPDKVMPYFYAHQFGYGMGGLILVSFLCDAMQTLVSGVNSISAIATKDVFQRIRSAGGGNGGLTELGLARILTVGVGLLATALALVLAWSQTHSDRNIVDLMPRTFNMFLGPLASLFVMGMFLPRVTARTAVLATLGAVAGSVLWSWWPEITGSAARPTITLAIGLPYLGGFVLAALLSLVLDSGKDHPGRAFTWRAVMRLPPV